VEVEIIWQMLIYFIKLCKKIYCKKFVLKIKKKKLICPQNLNSCNFMFYSSWFSKLELLVLVSALSFALSRRFTIIPGSVEVWLVVRSIFWRDSLLLSALFWRLNCSCSRRFSSKISRLSSGLQSFLTWNK